MATPISTEYSTDTVLGMINQYHAMMGGKFKYDYMPNTTLNTKYDILKPVQIDGVWSNVPSDNGTLRNC